MRFLAISLFLVLSLASHAADPEPTRQIQEIIVTATKREESLREIPASITAVSGEELTSSGAQGMADYMSKMPGATMNQGIGGNDSNRVTVRGMGLDTVNAVTSNPTGIFIDDTPFSDPFAAYVSPDLYPADLKSVEILKGPQGTLFGGSALTGLVRYTLAPAELGEWKARLSLTQSAVDRGESGHANVAMVNVPIGQSAAVRVVGIDRYVPGTVDELRRDEKDVNHTDQTGWRVLGKWQLTDELTISGGALDQQSRQYDYGFVDNPDGVRERDNTPDAAPWDTSFHLDSLRVDYAFDWANLVSLTSVSTKDLISHLSLSRVLINEAPPLPGDILYTTFDQHTRGVAQEFRLVSTATENWEWLVGLFGQKNKLHLVNHIVAGVPIGIGGIVIDTGETVTGITDAKVEEHALFGEVSRALGDQIKLSLGLRAFRIRTDGTSQILGRTLSAKIRDSGINPKFAITWQATEDMQLYTQASKGFRYGGLQVAAPTPILDANVPPTYGSDSIWNYEVGLRTDWLDRSLQADLVVFFIDWKDAQYSQPAPSAYYNFIDNIASAQSAGAEITVQYLPPIPGLRLSLAASFLDAHTTAPFDDASGNTIEPGTRMPGSSKIQTAVNVAYDRAVGPWLLGMNASHAYLGPGYNNLAHDFDTLDFQNVEVGAYVRRDDWLVAPELRLTVKNVFNRDGLVNVYNYIGLADYYYSEPRTISICLSLEF